VAQRGRRRRDQSEKRGLCPMESEAEHEARKLFWVLISQVRVRSAHINRSATPVDLAFGTRRLKLRSTSAGGGVNSSWRLYKLSLLPEMNAFNFIHRNQN